MYVLLKEYHIDGEQAKKKTPWDLNILIFFLVNDFMVWSFSAFLLLQKKYI